MFSKALKIAQKGGNADEVAKVLAMMKHTDKIDDVATVTSKLGTKSEDMVTMLGMKPKTWDKLIDVSSQGLTALTLNQAEGVMSATDVYKEAYQKAIDAGYNDHYAKQIASEGAVSTINANRANMLFNITSAGKLMRAANKLDDAASAAKSFKQMTGKERLKYAGDYLSESVQEGLEEGINEIASTYGKTTADKLIGNRALNVNAYDSQYSSNNANSIDTYASALGNTLANVMTGGLYSGAKGASGIAFGNQFVNLNQV